MRKLIAGLTLLLVTLSASAGRKDMIAILDNSPSAMGFGIPLSWQIQYQCYDDNGNPSGTVAEAPESGIFDIYRDGEWLTSVSNVSAYTDYAVKSGETHRYNVCHEGLCWEEDKNVTCSKSGRATPQFLSKVVIAKEGTIELSATATISTFDWADAEKTYKAVMSVESAYEAESDCDWITKDSTWSSLPSGDSAIWKIAANETGDDRVGHILVYPSGCAACAVRVMIVQIGIKPNVSEWKTLTFWDQADRSSVGTSHITLGWLSKGSRSPKPGRITYSPFEEPYVIYKDGKLYQTLKIEGSPHVWTDYDVKVGETYHYTVIAAVKEGVVVLDGDCTCPKQYVFRAEKSNYSVSCDGGTIDVPFCAEIQSMDGNNTGCAWEMHTDSSWVSFSSSQGAAAGTGNGTVKLTVEKNTTPWTRTATVTISPNAWAKVFDPSSTFTITQCGSSVNWEVVDGVRWEYSVNDDGTACIGCGADENHPAIELTMAGGVVIPAKLGGRKVTCIGDYAFYGCSKMTSVILPEGVEEVGDCAFANCSALRMVKLPSSVKHIGWRAFGNCLQLCKVDICDIANWCGIEFETEDSNPLTYAHNLCLNGRTVRRLVVPAAVSSISEYAFYACSGIRTLILHKNVKSIGTYTFRYCTGLTQVKIPACAVDVKRAFPEAYEQIESVVLCDDVTAIGEDAFNGCNALRFIVIPESVQTIGAGGLSCQSLEHIAVYSDAITLERYALWMCNSLTTVSVVDGDEATVKEKFVVEGSSVAPGVSTVNVLGDIVLVGKGDDGLDLCVSKWWCYQNLFGVDRSEQEIRDVLYMPSGKSDGEGKTMYVWQDFIAGTDPTKPEDTFKASITFDKDSGKPIVSWTPELSAAEAAKREYKVFGKAKINDKDWTLVDGDAENFNFFKVSVGMKP